MVFHCGKISVCRFIWKDIAASGRTTLPWSALWPFFFSNRCAISLKQRKCMNDPYHSAFYCARPTVCLRGATQQNKTSTILSFIQNVSLKYMLFNIILKWSLCSDGEVVSCMVHCRTLRESLWSWIWCQTKLRPEAAAPLLFLMSFLYI